MAPPELLADLFIVAGNQLAGVLVQCDQAGSQWIVWVAKLNNSTFCSPMVSQGRVFIGTAGGSAADARILCFDEQTGKELGTFVCGPSKTKIDNFGAVSYTHLTLPTN